MECRQSAMAAVITDEALRHKWRISVANYGMHLGLVEARRAFHPVLDWARSKPWDGVSRFGQLMDTLTIRDGFQDCRELLRVQMAKWLLSGGKCLSIEMQSEDGVAAQGVLVLQGPQNLGKTRWFKSLLPNSAWFSEGLTMDPSNKDHVIQGTATFICELGELDATTRKSDVAQLKAFLTRSRDVYRSPYGRNHEVYARRTIFGATVNPETFLVDDTGNRRFWVVPVAGVNADHGIDTQQLWAEAMARAEAGEEYWMPKDLQADQLSLASKFESRSEWADEFFKVFRLPVGPETGQAVRVSDIRATILPDRNWSVGDMRSFVQFLKKINVHLSQRQGVTHATVVRW
jgi:predicted P-loop ATPase